MSQRECAGFNWPPLSIPAEQPVSISPVTVRRAGVTSFMPLPRHFCGLSSLVLAPSIGSLAWGVDQLASVTAALSGLPLGWSHRLSLNSSVADSLRQSRAAAAVGQFANWH